MVDVTHDGDDRRARFLRSIGIAIAHYRFFQLVLAAQDHFMTHLFRYQLSCFLIDNLVDGRHRAHLHHRFDDLRTFHRHFVSQFGYGDGFADDDVTVNNLSRFVEALLQHAWLAVFAAFAAANRRARFFAIGFSFGMLVAFFRRTRRFSGGTRTCAARFNLTVVFVFSLTGMSRGSDVIVAFILFLRFFPFSRFLFSQAARFFSNAACVLFQLTARFFFRFTLQFSRFRFATGFVGLRSLGHIVGLMIRHFFFFRCFTLRLFSGFALGFLFGFTLRFFFSFATGLFFSLALRLFFRFTLSLGFCFCLFSFRITFYVGALFADFDLHRFTFTPGAWDIQGTACLTLQC